MLAIVCFAVFATSPPACRTTTLRPPGTQVAFEGQTMGGTVVVESLVVPAGTTIWVDEALIIRASGIVRIEGHIVARNASDLNIDDAPNIDIESPLAIDVPGTILGGRGYFPGNESRKGGNGSSVVLSAPIVYIDGSVTAGNGGDGGRGSQGGAGGHASVNGYMLIRNPDGHASLISGRGGDGGFPGGDGGDSGNAIAIVPDSVRLSLPELQPEIAAGVTFFL